ncbi:hypothetical protein QBC33DRAFT_619334 [Phialemonium atrogriseum]|uniref:Uncharacterized protein n=1 Tax=Phialemonium atrogriseum TaxID=1093897 RepID=A0AAJ0C0G8_9PEZI|nr:uncharacterized protein QBC33DRAFT_619334 [Phialemonium atrogriseum]KAK1767859.1 hypothetical protein QBC33DRAFT_619334 [Phialemonium atrogriseum]
MKAILFAVFAFAASTLATPIVAERQLDSQADELDSLIAQVQGYTANINKTTAAVPDNPDLATQTAAANDLAPDFQGITDALKSATAVLSKRAFGVTRSAACDSGCLGIKVKLLVWEISCTLKFVLVKLGLACVLLYLTPLIIALSGLLNCLDLVIDGILIAVHGILSDVLGGLGAGLLGLL